MALTVAERPDNLRPPRILLVDDDPLVQRIGVRLFAEPDYNCITATAASEALAQLPRIKPEVVILGALCDRIGLDVLQHLRDFDRRLPVLFIATAGNSGNTIEAMKRGAFDYLTKPLDLDLLTTQVQRAVQARRLMLAPVEIRPESDPLHEEHVLVGQSESMHEVYKAVGRVAVQDIPVLIAGEPGTGKELVARLIYENGPRSTGPFSTVKCRDFTSPLIDSELFGHEPESSSAAVRPHLGKIEQCQGGVLLLKEVGDLPLATQSKLLDSLRERRFHRLGGHEPLTSDVTILATTSEDLAAAVAAGRFQADLFYALGAFTITVPPLRQRREDIPLLVDHFVRRLARIGRTYSGSMSRVSEDALSLLTHYNWPGNIDELQSILKRAFIEGHGTVLATDSLKALPGQASNAVALNTDATFWRELVDRQFEVGSNEIYERAIHETEQRLLPLVMQSCGGSQVKAAKVLGMTRGSLRKKLRLHGLLAGPGISEENETEAVR